MSNGRPFRRGLSPAQDAMARLLGPLDGARMPGGCECCDAYQTVEPAAPGVWVNRVMHDDGCRCSWPTDRAIAYNDAVARARRRARARSRASSPWPAR